MEKNITVGIVTYNSSNEIDDLLKSIQECSSFEKLDVHVVDNASEDDTTDIIKNRYPWVNLIVNEKNIGFGRAHNIIINNIVSKYHIIVNPDIKLYKDTIKETEKYMDECEDVSICSPYVENEDGTQQYLPKRNPSFKYLLGGMLENKFKWAKKIRDEYTRKNECINYPVNVEFCTGAFMFVRTDVLKSVKGFDEKYFLHFEDADLTRKLREKGEAIYNPNIKVVHRWHRENRKVNKSFFVALKSMCIYMNKWGM